jgi:membrane-associated protease RseP (regulator of RpoE activity)
MTFPSIATRPTGGLDLHASWRSHRPRLRSAARRLAYFWVVWSALLIVHEGGHALSARRQGLEVSRVTIGVGPVLWRGESGDTKLALRLVPLAGVTTIATSELATVAAPSRTATNGWAAWRQDLGTLAGGILATLALAVGLAAAVFAWERLRHTRWTFGRYLIADAVVLTVFNFLPIPPLDGGRAVLGAFSAWHGAPIVGDALFWLQVGGLALAVVPMTIWTRWTAVIDRAAMNVGVRKK